MMQDLNKDKIMSNCFLLSISSPILEKQSLMPIVTFMISNCFSNSFSILMIDDSRRAHDTKSKQGQVTPDCFLLSISKP